MAEPKTVHVWLPDDRSLCDRRARVPDSKDREEELAGLEYTETAPICTACVILLHWLRFDLAANEYVHSTFWPLTQEKAWELLRGTRWDGYLNIDLANGPIISRLSELASAGLSQEQLQEAAEQKKERFREAKERLRVEIAKQLEETE